MADAIITLTIPEEKVSKALEGFLEVFPNIEKNPDESPKYTTSEWVTEAIRRKVVAYVMRGLQRIALREATLEPDDTMVIT